jgi:uncharacterized protein
MNRLAQASSAYLRSAAQQPVDWFPWSDEAFARAKAEDKPVLLDIGAVWCHWCHVMDHESYEDDDLAAFLNQHFVCIKVDRDERPDVDARYQRAVSALTGQGGWPLTAVLTADGHVFYGGTYFPPEDNHFGRPGFRTVLERVLEAHRTERDRITDSVRQIREHVAAALDEAKPGPYGPALVDQAIDRMVRLFDIRYGGFGDAPKFPHPAAIELLISRWWDTGHPWLRDVVEKTLAGMARGGIRDHVGGGFHRYSVDERWIVPHFEKMSYDNSELLHAYLSAYQAFGTPLYREVAEGIAAWAADVLFDKARSVFGSSQDADVGPNDDGNYFTWTPDEARDVLDRAEWGAVEQAFDVREQGEMHHHPEKNVLWLARPPANDGERDLLRRALGKLKSARDRRPRPYVDRTPYVSWNAMMASAFLHAGAVLDLPDLNRMALGALERIWTEARDGDALRHAIAPGGPTGLLDDQVQAAAAFVDAFEATGDRAWLDRATQLLTYCWRELWDHKDGGFRDLKPPAGAIGLLGESAKPIQDSPTPSANGTAALTLGRLAEITGAAEWRERRDATLAAFAGRALELSLHGATLLRAIDLAANPVHRIEVAGPKAPGAACDMHLLALQTYRPRKVVIRDPADAPRATVCVGTTCSLAAADRAAFAKTLERALPA